MIRLTAGDRALNAGLATARGLYVTFPAADDMLYPTLYQRLLAMAEQDNLDVAQCNGDRFFAGSQRIKTLIPLRSPELDRRAELYPMAATGTGHPALPASWYGSASIACR